ncbi:Sugar lactone lactonase YvrE [Microbacterium sp. cf046]|uniref:SMP-30/gluconolactonase/LRE family protein n=1 Tax=Microbacterium sp. cf046 TaxID=1761803 RepID=UPI0008E76642|nr:SMP-30/gluconolactonase/LRE family protein [Microbacterium sp. cf046]SFR94917.1 Sugar lactone lactonase YvrE [Microbacterium sp. cf046]
MKATPASERAFVLGEGPLWDDRTQALLWVDIQSRQVHRGTLIGERIEPSATIGLPATVGAVALTERDDRWLAAVHDRLMLIGPTGPLAHTPPWFDGAVRRFNDGQVDPTGRFVVGTLRLEGGSTTEKLLRADSREVTVIDDDLTLSNGLAWSADGSRFYSIDTISRTIRVRSYDPIGDAIGDWSVFATLDRGYPDGMCIDADDHLWVAVWGGGAVLRFSPEGAIVDRIEVAAPHTSSVTFAGPELDVLVITTAREELTAQQLREFPRSGCLFTATPGVHGVPVRRVAASVIDRLFPTL